MEQRKEGEREGGGRGEVGEEEGREREGEEEGIGKKEKKESAMEIQNAGHGVVTI